MTADERAQERRRAINDAQLLARESGQIHFVAERLQRVHVIPCPQFLGREWKNCLLWVAFPPRHK